MSAPDLDEAQLLRLEERLDECVAALAETLTSFGFGAPFVITTVGDVRGHVAARVAAVIHGRRKIADAGAPGPRCRGRRRV